MVVRRHVEIPQKGATVTQEFFLTLAMQVTDTTRDQFAKMLGMSRSGLSHWMAPPDNGFFRRLPLLYKRAVDQILSRHGLNLELTVEGVAESLDDLYRPPRQATPMPTPKQKLTAWGETLTIAQWSTRMGVPETVVIDRLKQGIPADEAIVP